MDIITLFSLAVGLAMDAFAVSICKGLAQEKLSVKHMVTAGLWCLPWAIFWEVSSEIRLQQWIIGSHLFFWALSA